jgi:succinyl-CoA:(S)-malate CoA-transferase subunit B
VTIACTTDKLWSRLGEAMGRSELSSSSRYAETKTRHENRTDLNEIVRDWRGSFSREPVLDRCHATGAPAGPLNNIAEIVGDRQFHARRNMVAIDDNDLAETVIIPNVVPRLSRTPRRIKHLGPRLGQQTAEVLKELAGLSDAEIADLRAARDLIPYLTWFFRSLELR